MSVILSLPPRLVDNSFPRDRHDLNQVVEALSEITERARSNKVLILSTDTFKLIVEGGFNWAGAGSDMALKQQIYSHLSYLFLSGAGYWLEIECQDFRGNGKHPLPEGMNPNSASLDLWREEMAAALRWHDQHAGGNYYIGIACPKAFSGGAVGQYPPQTDERKFPIVGPTEVDSADGPLKKAFVHALPAGMSVPAVSFQSAKRNLHLLGASEIRNPSSGSHYKVKFPGIGSWTLDPNHDPVLPMYLQQLKALSGYEYPVICYVLNRGEFPPTKRFDQP